MSQLIVDLTYRCLHSADIIIVKFESNRNYELISINLHLLHRSPTMHKNVLAIML